MSQSYNTASYRTSCTRTATNSQRRRPRPLSGGRGGEEEGRPTLARSPALEKVFTFQFSQLSSCARRTNNISEGKGSRVSWSHFASHQVFHSLFAMSTHDIRDKLDGLNGASPTAHMLIGFPDAGSMLHSRDATSCLYWDLICSSIRRAIILGVSLNLTRMVGENF